MRITPQFLDQLRERTSLSGLIGQSIKVTKAGREFKACCPFHGEKTPSFTINDDKLFGHCFGCGWHGDAIRWLTDYRQMTFIDAVAELAAAAGLEMPARSAAAAARAAQIEGIRPALSAAAEYFGEMLIATRSARYYLEDRKISDAMIAEFGIGYAPRGKDYCKHLGITAQSAADAGLLWQADGKSGMRFAGRIMVPVHDARGKIISFGGRDIHAAPGQTGIAKYKNGSDTALFDKGRTLFNMHRALPHARAKAGSPGRLIACEGYMDVIALSGAGIPECVAPMGTALTIHQLEMLWRVQHSPILMFDGDKAGRAAAMRACETALPELGPGKSLCIAALPAGRDPDDIINKGGGAAEINALCDEAKPISEFLFEAVTGSVGDFGHGAGRTPEDIANIWYQLEALTAQIKDGETRAQYWAVWRARYERDISAAPRPCADLALLTYRQTSDGSYEFPDTENESEQRFLYILQNMLGLREAERLAVFPIRETKKSVKAMAKTIGIDGKALDAVCKMIETDAGTREEREMILALYRRVAGVKGPLFEAVMPNAMRDVFASSPAPHPRSALPAPRRAAAALAWHDIDAA